MWKRTCNWILGNHWEWCLLLNVGYSQKSCLVSLFYSKVLSPQLNSNMKDIWHRAKFLGQGVLWNLAGWHRPNQHPKPGLTWTEKNLGSIWPQGKDVAGAFWFSLQTLWLALSNSIWSLSFLDKELGFTLVDILVFTIQRQKVCEGFLYDDACYT